MEYSATAEQESRRFDKRFMAILAVMLGLTGYLFYIVWASVSVETRFSLASVRCVESGTPTVCYDLSPAVPEIFGVAEFNFRTVDSTNIDSAALFIGKTKDGSYSNLDSEFSSNGSSILLRNVDLASIPTLLNTCNKDTNGEYYLKMSAVVRSNNIFIGRNTITTAPIQIKLLDKSLKEPSGC